MDQIEKQTHKMTTTNALLSTGIMIVAIAGLLTGFGGPFSALWLALGGFSSLYLLDGFDLYQGKVKIRHLILGALLLIVVILISFFFTTVFKDSGSANPAVSLLTKRNFFFMWLTMIVPSLIGEEAFTAAFIKIGQAFTGSIWAGIALSTLLFTAIHVPEYHGSIVSLTGVLGARLVFTFIAFRKNSNFKTATILHILYDSMIFAMAIF